MQLFEEYRPKNWGEIVGQDRVIQRINVLARRGLSGRAFWLSGSSGTGKTSIAWLLAAECADDWATEEIDASALTVRQVRQIEKRYACRSLGKGFAYIVNESHGLRKDVIRQLLVTLERIPSHVVWIFTTTIEGQESLFDDYDDANPLLSR